MECYRCGVNLPGGRGAYRWRSEVVALGDDVLQPPGDEEEFDRSHRRIFEELAAMSPEEIEADVYQLWEGLFCRRCRFELGRILREFLETGNDS